MLRFCAGTPRGVLTIFFTFRTGRRPPPSRAVRCISPASALFYAGEGPPDNRPVPYFPPEVHHALSRATDRRCPPGSAPRRRGRRGAPRAVPERRRPGPLGVPPAAAGGAAGGPGPRLGPHAGRCVHLSSPGEGRLAAGPAGGPADAAAAGDVRPHRPAADARRGGRFP